MTRFACSLKPRPRTATAARNNTWWKREPYHALASGILTECGRDASEWLRIDDISDAAALADTNLCAICKRRLTARLVRA